jgi:hypothetical protein
MTSIKYNLIILAILLPVIFILLSLDASHEEKAIQEKIEGLGGVVTDVDSILFEDTPFKWHEETGKGITIYKVTYEKDNEEKVAWVKFYMSEEWIIDGKRVK